LDARLEIGPKTAHDVVINETFYLAHREQVAAYLARVRQQQEEAWQEQQQHPSEFVRMLRERLDQQRQLYQAAQPRLAVAAERSGRCAKAVAQIPSCKSIA
jgi:hypothetical protein